MKINIKSPLEILKLTKEQRKIIYISLVVLASLICFWIFIYGPQSRKFTEIKNNLKSTEEQIAGINAITQGKELAEAVKELKTDLIKLAAKFPPGEEVLIQRLSELAKKKGMRLENITPGARKSSGEIVSGYDVEELAITTSLSGEFKALGEYLIALRENFPVLVKIRQINIQGSKEGQVDLSVSLGISAYLAKEK